MTNHWLTQRAFLSAHCGFSKFGVNYSPYCDWFAADDLLYESTTQAAPRIFVSAGKHANYTTWERCDEAYGWSPGDESCDNLTVPFKFPISLVRQNIGSRAVPLPWSTSPCPKATGSGLFLDPNATECLWTAGAFAGGQYPDGPLPSASTAYGKALRNTFGL